MNNLKLLFIHNTMAEYRIPFFVGLSKMIDVDYLFTNIYLSKEIYGTNVDKYEIKDINIDYLPTGIKRYKKLFKCIRKEDYDFVIIPPMDSFRDLIDSLIIFILSKLRGNKLLYFGEKWEAPKERQPIKKKLKNFLQKMAFKFILTRIDMCIVSGSKSKEYFKDLGIREQNISIAIDASGVNENISYYDIRDNRNIYKDTKIILYYGRIVERKGLDILIRAYKKLENEDRNVCLIVCGDGPFKNKCEDLVKKLNLKKVIFEGFVNPKNKYTFFSQCDVFVLPSYFHNGTPEAWGLTVNEALQCGKPVIATEAVGAAYDLLNGKNGSMIKENDVDDLADTLKEFLFEKSIDEIKYESVKIYKEFDYKNMINSFISALNKCN